MERLSSTLHSGLNHTVNTAQWFKSQRNVSVNVLICSLSLSFSFCVCECVCILVCERDCVCKNQNPVLVSLLQETRLNYSDST